ncbi:phage holin family protein [Aromatoleum sp.]|uniref:phage holin family protein n=1 Tax=Aromatoleum sp. TaxID=2307007 RepID=UPI002FCA935B
MAATTNEGIGTDRSLSGLLHRSRRLASAFASLVVLDARQTVRELLQAMCAAIAAIVLLVTAWLALVVAIAGWLIADGVPWTVVLALAALANVVVAAIAGWWLWKRVKKLPFAATLRQLRGEPPPSATPVVGDAGARTGP